MHLYLISILTFLSGFVDELALPSLKIRYYNVFSVTMCCSMT